MALEKRTKFSVPAGTAVVHHLYPLPYTTIAVTPAATGTAVVAVQVVRGGTWFAADGNLAGTIAAATPKADTLVGVFYAIRITATTAAAVVEVSQ